MRLILICLIALITAIAAILAGLSADTISFSGPGFSGNTSPAALLFLLILVILATSLAWMALAWLTDLPWPGFSSNRTTRKRAQDALARGLIAVEAGDAKAAAKYAERTERLIAEQHKHKKKHDRAMALLLAARAAQTNQDWAGAERAYAALAREKNATIAGLRGLAAAAMTRGDLKGAEQHINTAMHTNKQLTWPLVHLFDLQLATADWAGACDTVDVGLKRKMITADVASRRRCALLSAQAAEKCLDAPQKAGELLETALKNDAAFPPAAEMAARLKLAAGHPDTARRILRSVWRHSTHPALAALWSRAKPDKTTPHDHLQTLAATNPDTRDSRILIAQALISSGDWTEAETILLPYIEQQITDRLCALMEMIARGRGDTDAATQWTRKAMHAQIERGWNNTGTEPATAGNPFDFNDNQWATLILSFGDSGIFSDPRYPDRSEPRLSAVTPVAALPEKPQDAPCNPPVPDHVPNN